MRALLLTALVTFALSPALASEPDPAEHLLEDLTSALPDSVSLDGKVVYVDFWASWCVPCRKSFPWMESMTKAHADDGLQIVTVNLDTKEKAAHRFLSDLHVTLPVVYDPQGKLAEKCQLQAMPSAFVFARDGTLQKRHEGFRNEDRDELEALLQRLLDQGARP
jgi:thiol-disulfide isomerase/thioredoxin